MCQSVVYVLDKMVVIWNLFSEGMLHYFWFGYIYTKMLFVRTISIYVAFSIIIVFD